ncbi:MAG: MGMT family protein [Anaerolineales bacterium]|nr:MGMT family protein [Anaerolineales bacterium]
MSPQNKQEVELKSNRDQAEFIPEQPPQWTLPISGLPATVPITILQMLKIPHGSIRSYSQITDLLRPGAAHYRSCGRGKTSGGTDPSHRVIQK